MKNKDSDFIDEERIHEYIELESDNQGLQETLEKLQDAFYEFDLALKNADRNVWNRWKAGGKMVSDEFVTNYPSAQQAVDELG